MSNKNSLPTHSRSSSSNTEKCLFSFRVINRLNNLSCCLTCFCDTGLISHVQSFEIFITHHIPNGPYTPWICVFCQRDNIQSRPITLCTLCIHAYTNQLVRLRNRRIDLSNAHFLFDVFNNKFDYIGSILERDDRK